VLRLQELGNVFVDSGRTLGFFADKWKDRWVHGQQTYAISAFQAVVDIAVCS
jgi:hypothetical protein